MRPFRDITFQMMLLLYDAIRLTTDSYAVKCNSWFKYLVQTAI